MTSSSQFAELPPWMRYGLRVTAGGRLGTITSISRMGIYVEYVRVRLDGESQSIKYSVSEIKPIQ
jgi:hypothetical protein